MSFISHIKAAFRSLPRALWVPPAWHQRSSPAERELLLPCHRPASAVSLLYQAISAVSPPGLPMLSLPCLRVWHPGGLLCLPWAGLIFLVEDGQLLKALLFVTLPLGMASPEAYLWNVMVCSLPGLEACKCQVGISLVIVTSGCHELWAPEL